MIIFHVSNRILEPYTQISLIHVQSFAHLILITCIETIQIANELIE
jgi:hypothetical protein